MATLCFNFISLCIILIQFQFQLGSPVMLVGLKKWGHHPPGMGHHRQPQPMFQGNQTGCSLFIGTWVHDDSYPIYTSSACPAVQPEFNCQLFGRPDSDYLKYRWRPANCELPRFNGLDFLSKMKGKSVMFVGDSLGLNQWQSLICMIWSAVPSSATQINRGDPLSSFQFLEYGVTVSFYKAPYLVDIDSEQGRRVLKLEDISGNAQMWRGVDVLLFNTGHWWTHTGHLQGWDYMEAGGALYEDMDRLRAMERGLRTWSKWVDNNVDHTRIRVFFQTISPTHNNPSEWSVGSTTIGKTCYGETSPMSGMSGTTYPGEYSDQMEVVEAVMRDMNNPAYILDITTLSAMRKDAHPSIYSGDLSPEQRANPDHSADCSHWCLPGLPDTWNQLFYTALFF